MNPKAVQQGRQVADERSRSLIQQVLSVPNQLTMFRMLLMPFILIAMIYERHDMAFWLFLAAAVSDSIDGLVARHFNQKTMLGEFLDPIADKLLLSSCFVVQAFIGAIPWWITVLVISRDVIIIATVLVVVLATEVRDFPPSVFGKANTVVQIAAMFSILVHNYLHTEVTSALTTTLIWAAAATILLSSVHYAIDTSRRLQEHHAGASRSPTPPAERK